MRGISLTIMAGIGCALTLAVSATARAQAPISPAQATAARLRSLEKELAGYKNGQWGGHVATARERLKHCAGALETPGGAPAGGEVTETEPETDLADPVLLADVQELWRLATDDAATSARCAADLRDAAEELKLADSFYLAKHGGEVSAPTVPVVALTARQAWPSPAYTDFMAAMPDQALRQKLWTYFFSAEREAHAIAAYPERWVPLVRVEYSSNQKNPGVWSNGVIHMKAGRAPSDYAGAMFHEIFHTAFERSVFHETPGDRKWNEAFCNAFRYAAERKLMVKPSHWVQKTDEAGAKTFEQLIAKNDSSQTRVYVYPGTLIVKKSGGTMEGLHALWNQLWRLHEQQHGDVLDRFFGYTPQGVRK